MGGPSGHSRAVRTGPQGSLKNSELRHVVARNHGHSRMEQAELEDVKQWIAIRQNRDNSESEP